MTWPEVIRRAAAALCALLTICIPAGVRAADPIEIYVIESLTGALAFIGKAHFEALGAFEETVNKAGGINGRPIHFVVQDDQTNPQLAVQLMNQIAAKQPPFILGPDSSGNCLAVFPLAKNGPVTYCYSNAVNPQPGSFEFGAMNTNYDLNVGGVRFLRMRGLTRLALISPTDATGQTYDRAFDAILRLPENRGMTLVVHEHFNPGDVSVAAQMAKIRAARPDALIIGTAGTAAGTVLHGIADAGLDLPVMTGSGTATTAFMKQYAAYLPQELYVQAYLCYAPALATDRRQKEIFQSFAAAIAARGLSFDCMQSTAWDPALILTSALRKLGPNATGEQVRSYIANLSGFPGVNGIYDFKRTPQRGLDDRSSVVVRWDAAKNGWIPASKLGGAPLP